RGNSRNPAEGQAARPAAAGMGAGTRAHSPRPGRPRLEAPARRDLRAHARGAARPQAQPGEAAGRVSAVEPRIVAALGPTKPGKRQPAVEPMLEHPTGMLGLPPRLLAGQVYDRVTQRLGEAQVALVTGEEKRIPSDPRYWICTVEAMPIERAVDFL